MSQSLMNGFAHLRNTLCVLDSYKDEVERDLLAMGRALSKQSDIHLPCTHFSSGYLPNKKSKKFE